MAQTVIQFDPLTREYRRRMLLLFMLGRQANPVAASSLVWLITSTLGDTCPWIKLSSTFLHGLPLFNLREDLDALFHAGLISQPYQSPRITASGIQALTTSTVQAERLTHIESKLETLDSIAASQDKVVKLLQGMTT